MTTAEMPPIQLFVQLVVLAPKGTVLLARYDQEDERWMIPYTDLEPYGRPGTSWWRRQRASYASCAPTRMTGAS